MQDVVRTFEDQGYVVIRDVLDSDLMSEIRGHVQWCLDKAPAGTELVQFAANSDDPFWHKIVSDKRLLDIAEAFLGPDLALFASAYFAKAANGGKPVAWHQDGDYWPLEPLRAVSLWIAVDHSTPENGAMRVIPGTHKLGLQGLQPAQGSVLNSGMDPSLVDETKAVDIILKPGDVSIHHPNTFHGSLPNNSPMRRCGLVIRYIPTSTRIIVDDPSLKNGLDAEGRWPVAFLLRGKAVPGINEYKPAPEFIPERHFDPTLTTAH